MEFSLSCGFSKFFIDGTRVLFAKDGGEKRQQIRWQHPNILKKEDFQAVSKIRISMKRSKQCCAALLISKIHLRFLLRSFVRFT